MTQHVGVSKRGDGEIVYEPPAGPTIREAITYAIEIAQEEKKPVELHLNDIILTVNQGSKVESIAAKYFSLYTSVYSFSSFKSMPIKTMYFLSEDLKSSVYNALFIGISYIPSFALFL